MDPGTPNMTTLPAEAPSPRRQFYRRPLPETCLSFSSDEGKQVFAEALTAGHMNGYFGLAAQFRTQDEPAYCGLSTLVMVLNTLEVDPKKVWKGPWRWYHEHMLDCCVPLDIVKTSGITLEQFACLAVCNTLSIAMTRVDSNSANVDTFRESIKQYTRLTEQVIVASYSRKVLKQTGDGHFSPIGGYHPGRDLVLMLDTARFKYPPHWIPVSLLWEAMQALDTSTGLPRGYFIMSKAKVSPLLMFRISPHLSVTLSFESAAVGGVFVFRQRWQTYITSTMRDAGMDENMVLMEAVATLLDCLRELKQHEQVLSTQVDLHCSPDLSDEHSCAVQTLVTCLEKLPTFDAVRSHIQDNPSLASTHAVSSAACCPRAPPKGDEDKSGTECCVKPLENTHFITMLLLSWPYEKCDGTVGHAILKVVTAQLVSSHVVLQNETAQLRQQFESVLGYLDRTTCEQCMQGRTFGSQSK